VSQPAESVPRPTTSPYSGYYRNQIPAHDPFLTETGPGTPAGEYMRRFWHPVCMSEELTDTPRYLKIMGEELVAFRDKSGRVGLLHLHCAHRGASLEYGMIQERGIMCCYHGFVFDVDGMCLEVPFPKGEEQEAARAKEKICQGAYKAFERDGLVFAYMGPPEEEPPFPNWENDFTVHPDDHLAAYSNFQTCNWLQVQDNSADQYHHVPLHSTAVVPGHEQGTTFGEAGAAPYLVRPDLQYFPVHEGRGIAWTSSRRVNEERIFIRVNHQILPNISFHSYLFEDGTAKQHFTRVHMMRWTVPVDDENSKMIGWRVMGPHLDRRGIGKENMVGFEKMDFLEGQCGMRRPERESYGQGELPPLPTHHRNRSCYKAAQWAPGDFEAVTSQRTIAVHALENPMKFDQGVFMFRKLMRDAINGKSPGASPQGWRDALAKRMPNTFCSGNVLEVPQGATMDEEVERRRVVARQVIEALIASDDLEGEERAAFVRGKFEEIERAHR
jgi:phenylpropionate dioxygenase-like ring-hydroxylating dioxygenase large terminal subunit